MGPKIGNNMVEFEHSLLYPAKENYGRRYDAEYLSRTI